VNRSSVTGRPARPLSSADQPATCCRKIVRKKKSEESPA